MYFAITPGGHCIQDLTKRAFHEWRVLEYSHHTPKGKACWLCRCSCGLEKVVEAYTLTSGRSRACRKCSAKKFVAPKLTTHGGSRSDLYSAWSAMKQRCYNPRQEHSFRYYGAQGVRVCDEWLHDFEAFAAHVGPRPSPAHSIDRYPDKDGPYAPGNVRWATGVEQQRNRRWLSEAEKGERYYRTLCGDSTK